MKLNSIVIRGLKSHVTWESNLAPLTIFTGRNGAGKTSILQAIRFGVLGYDPSVGKGVSKLVALLNGPELFVRLTADKHGGPVSVARKLTLHGSALSQAIRVTPAEGEQNLDAQKARVLSEFGDCRVAFDLLEFLDLSPDKRRDFIFHLGASATFDVEALNGKVEAALAAAKDITDEGRAGALGTWQAVTEAAAADGVEGVLDLLDSAMARLRDREKEANAQKKAHQAAVQRLTDELATLPMDHGSMAEAQARYVAEQAAHDAAVKDAEAARGRVESRRAARDRDLAITQALASLPAEEDLLAAFQAAGAALVEGENSLAAMRGELKGLEGNIEEVGKARDLAFGHMTTANTSLAVARQKENGINDLLVKLGTCKMEGSPDCCLTMKRTELARHHLDIVPLQAAAEDAAEAKDTAEAEHLKIKKQRTPMGKAVDGLTEALRPLRAAETHAANMLRDRRATQASLLEERARLEAQAAVAPNTGDDLVVLDARVQGHTASRDALQEVVTRIARRETIEKSAMQTRQDLSGTEIELDGLKLLKMALGPRGIQGALAEGVFGPLTTAANALLSGLPAGKLLAIQTESPKGDAVTDLGWMKGGKLIPFEVLSMGERLQFGAALAVGLMTLKGARLKVLLVDDFQSVDDVNRGPFLASLRHMIQNGVLDQAIVATVDEVSVPPLAEGEAEVETSVIHLALPEAVAA